jgi:hypothetical protein
MTKAKGFQAKDTRAAGSLGRPVEVASDVDCNDSVIEMAVMQRSFDISI